MQEKDAIYIHTTLMKISQKIERISKKQFSEEMANLTLNEVRALFLLRESRPSNMSVIAHLLNIAVSTATAVIDKMVKKGLAIRWVSDDDRRQWLVDLTPEALRLADEMEKHAVEGTVKFLECLSETEIVFLKEIFQKIDTAITL